jgi:predicted phosphoribosyltransferase
MRWGIASLADRTVILVDDGIATGATFYASLGALRACRVRHLIAAVLVAPPRVPQELRSQIDEIVILETPAVFFGIGQFYADFAQVSDEEVVEALERSQAAPIHTSLRHEDLRRSVDADIVGVDGSDQSYEAVRPLSWVQPHHIGR